MFDGATGKARFGASHSSFTATEASLVADVDGDGHAEMLMVSSGADPGQPTDAGASGWKCIGADGTPVTMNGFTWQPGSITKTRDEGERRAQRATAASFSSATLRARGWARARSGTSTPTT